jgi:hypothetical protein
MKAADLRIVRRSDPSREDAQRPRYRATDLLARAGRTLLGSRLVHFLVVGGLIFALAPRPDPSRDVAFDSATFAALEQAQAHRLGTPVLDAAQAREVRARAIEDEILYREAIRLGFDRDDIVVRQRLVQKVLFLAEDLAGVSRPVDEAALRAFFEATRSQWSRPAHVRLIHVYAGPDHREQLVQLRDRVIAAEMEHPAVPPSLGEAFALPRAVTATHEDVARDYGAEFADGVFALDPGIWSEPMRSRFGWHLVKVLARDEGGPARFEDVQGKLPLALLVARKKQAAADLIRQAAKRYRITVDGKPLGELEPSGRTAPERTVGPD